MGRKCQPQKIRTSHLRYGFFGKVWPPESPTFGLQDHGFPADFPWTNPVKKNAACLSLQSFQASVHFSGEATLEEPINGFQTEDLQDYVPRIEKGCFFLKIKDSSESMDWFCWENWNRKAPYLTFMRKSPWFPVKIFPTKPIHWVKGLLQICPHAFMPPNVPTCIYIYIYMYIKHEYEHNNQWWHTKQHRYVYIYIHASYT